MSFYVFQESVRSDSGSTFGIQGMLWSWKKAWFSMICFWNFMKTWWMVPVFKTMFLHSSACCPFLSVMSLHDHQFGSWFCDASSTHISREQVQQVSQWHSLSSSFKQNWNVQLFNIRLKKQPLFTKLSKVLTSETFDAIWTVLNESFRQC